MTCNPVRVLALAIALFTGAGAVSADGLSLPVSDIRVALGKNDCIELWIRKTPDRGSVLLVEAVESGSRGFSPYSLRTLDYDPVTGDEVRILDGRRLTGAESGYSLVDSSPEFHDELGLAFHIRIPRTVQFGYPAGRSGMLAIEDGARFDIRIFSLPFADYAGPYADNPFRLLLSVRPPVAPVPAVAKPAPVVAKPAPVVAKPAPIVATPPVVFVLPRILQTSGPGGQRDDPAAVPDLPDPGLRVATAMRRPARVAEAEPVAQPGSLPEPVLAPAPDLGEMNRLRDEMAKLYSDTALLVAQNRLDSGDSSLLYELLDSGKLQYEALFEELDISIRNNIENGYIIDPRNLKDIVVYVSKMFRYNSTGGIKDGDRAFVFRGEDEPIGYIEFSRSGQSSFASLVELASSDTPIQPFDKIIFDLK
jgi:hypothetical protein